MDLLSSLILLVVLIFSAILHEIAHGLVAERLGDPTARLAGRLTLNPKNHIDPIMSIALPLILLISGSPIIFGAAKPVPVDQFNLRDGRKDMALVSLAGPLTNVLLAVIASLLIKLLVFFYPVVGSNTPMIQILSFVGFFLTVVVHTNLLLAIFNLLPIPPLDGSKIFSLLLPEGLANAYLSLESVGFIIIFFLLMSNSSLSLGTLMSNLLTFSEHLLGL